MLIAVEEIQNFPNKITDPKLCYDLSHDHGRSLLNSYFKQKTKEDLPEILKEPTGKPYFSGGTWHFNLSHSGNFVAVALDQAPVGIDLQIMKKPSSALIQRVCSKEEQVWLSNLEEKSLISGFSILWSGKESILKQKGCGVGNGRELAKLSIPLSLDFNKVLALTNSKPIFLSCEKYENLYLSRFLHRQYSLAITSTQPMKENFTIDFFSSTVSPS